MNIVAAVYARKSTDQLGLADDQKSVTRQVEHARGYAERKGWTVADELVFVDDAVSGAEFATRPGSSGSWRRSSRGPLSRSWSWPRSRGSGASRSRSPTR